MQYYVDFNSLEEYKNELDKNIKVINDELKNIMNAQSDVVWSGDAYSAVMDNINSRLNVLSQMTKILSLLSQFMGTASSNYQEGMEDIKKTFAEILDEIKQEKKKRGIIWEEL